MQLKFQGAKYSDLMTQMYDAFSGGGEKFENKARHMKLFIPKMFQVTGTVYMGTLNFFQYDHLDEVSFTKMKGRVMILYVHQTFKHLFPFSFSAENLLYNTLTL